MHKKIVIIGGVAGGASAAARLRRMDEHAEIILLERGEFISFANCGLPYYIGGTIEDREELLVLTAEDMTKKFNFDVRPFNEVTSINRSNKTVTVKNLTTGKIYEESYDNVILSPGASPLKPPIPGLDTADNVYTLRNIPDTDLIKQKVDTIQPQNAVVIGGGFIGVEMAENLVDRDIHVTLVEMLDQIMAPMDYEMASVLHNHLREKGVNLILSDGVKAFHKNGAEIELNSGKLISSDITMLAIGVKPENQLAKDAGLDLGERGGIKVTKHMQTSDPYIYAVGDAIEVTDYITGLPTMIPLAGPANKQARIAADNICGRAATYPGTMGTAVVKVFDMTAASTGVNEKRLRQLNLPFQALHIHPGSHAGYYPGANSITMKLLFDPANGKILGAQAVGWSGVEKRIDVIATAIKGGLTVSDLQELELSYAPPYSSAKDPVNMLGFAATNVIESLTDSFQWHEVDKLVSQKAIMIDVRDDNEHETGSIDHSTLIPLNQLRTRMSEIPKNQPIYVYCQVGIRGYLASRILKQHGFSQVKNLDGGYRTYMEVFHPDDRNQFETQVNESGVAKILV